MQNWMQNWIRDCGPKKKILDALKKTEIGCRFRCIQFLAFGPKTRYWMQIRCIQFCVLLKRCKKLDADFVFYNFWLLGPNPEIGCRFGASNFVFLCIAISCMCLLPSREQRLRRESAYQNNAFPKGFRNASFEQNKSWVFYESKQVYRMELEVQIAALSRPHLVQPIHASTQSFA